jgi:hypothetical protein
MTSFTTKRNPFTLKNFGIEIEFLLENQFGVNLYEKVATAINNAGVEARAEGYNHTTRRHWKVTYDASVSAPGYKGLEVVSPILKGQKGLDEIEIVCGALQALGAKINITCGLHVHHDARHLRGDDRKLQQVVDIYNRAEKVIDSMLPPSRRMNTYCRSNTVTDATRDRYAKVNLTSMYRHGTVEFRQHSGTIDCNKIKNWVLLTGLIFDRATTRRARKGKAFSRYDLERYLGIDLGRSGSEAPIAPEMIEVATYFRGRIRHFAA